MNCREVVGEPPGKKNIRDAAAFSTEPRGHLSERTPKAVRGEDERFRTYNRRRQGGASV